MSGKLAACLVAAHEFVRASDDRIQEHLRESQGTDFALFLGMAKNKTNQERGRKYGGSSSFVDIGQPSRAPRQDEQGEESNSSASRGLGPADGTSPQQGISNRPAKDEHAFPEPDAADPQGVLDSVDDEPKQVGGNRGQV